MDAYVKGFSFIPDTDITINDHLKYIQSDELEQTWKVARRERIKQRDQRIWEEFVQEQDVVTKICQDDPYQFLEQLPESCIQELLEVELQKIKQEHIEEEIQVQAEPQETPEDVNNECATAIVDSDKDSNVFHIFDDKDDEAEVSGQEEILNESVESVPCTVRENIEKEPEQVAVSRPNSGDKASSKSSENVTSFIESSIYCARIKELRIKINGELLDMITFLDQNAINIDPEEMPRLSKRTAEFSTRYHRVHVYQLQRQVHDMGRHAREGVAGAARHTHAHAQLARLVALHQSLLHAIQVLNKYVSRSGWSPDTGSLVDALAGILRDAGSADTADTAVPKPTQDDLDIEATCERLRAAVRERVARVAEYVNNINASSSSKSTKVNNKKKFVGNWSNSKPVDSRLSMYSLGGRARTHRATPSGTPKPTAAPVTGDRSPPKPAPVKNEKTPRRRRALPELHTLVEAVAPCTSTHISREASPRITPKSDTTSPVKANTPKNKDKTHATKQESPKTADTERQKCKREESEMEKDKEGSRSGRGKEKTRESNKCSHGTPDDVSKLLRELCSGDGLSTRNDHGGPKNVQLVCVNSSSPRQPSTPQLLRILEETIQKKSPRMTPKINTPIKDAEKLRMTLNIPEDVTEKLFQYRTKFVQHMLTSSLYANSAVGKPWEMIGSVSEQIINELLLNCAKEMELEKFTEDLYMSELC